MFVRIQDSCLAWWRTKKDEKAQEIQTITNQFRVQVVMFMLRR